MSKKDEMPVFKKTKIASTVSSLDQSVAHGSDDNLELTNSDYNWGELNQLKDELGASIIEFLNQVTSISMNPEVVAAIKASGNNESGNKFEYFNNLVSLFMKDIDSFSKKVKHIRQQHEHLSGKITDVTQFNLYNRLSIDYQVLYTELVSLVSPTLTEIVALVHEAQVHLQNSKAEQPLAAE